MTVIPITCDNCGAKYKLPPTFKGSQAKCQKCGSVIDVAKQRASAADSPAAAAKPASARPAAAARPAVDRSKQRATGRGKPAKGAGEDKASRPARGRAGGTRSRRGAKDDGGGEDGDSPRRGRSERQQKANQTPMILGGVGLLAIIVVVVVFMMGGNDDKQGDEQAKNTTTANGGGDGNAKAAGAGAETAGGDKPAGDTGAGDTGKPADASGQKTGDEPTEDPEGDPAIGDEPDGDKPAGGDPEPDKPVDDGDPNRVKQPWEKQKNPPQTIDQVVPASERYGEVQWPESIGDEKKAEVRGIMEDIEVDGGLRHIRAKRKLVDEGYAALFGIAEKLRELDYRQAGDAGLGFELNKVIEEITGGLNARYAAVQAGETIHPAKAEWNTKTVNAWMKTFAKWPDEKALQANKRERAKKNG